MKTENLAFLESVTRQFSSLPIFVDCNKVRQHFEYIFCAWMEAFQVCKFKSTADRTCHFTPLSARIEVSNIISRSMLNEKLVFSSLIKVASLTIFCVALPSYNFMVSIKDDFYCGYLLWETKDDRSVESPDKAWFKLKASVWSFCSLLKLRTLAFPINIAGYPNIRWRFCKMSKNLPHQLCDT